MKNRIYFSFDYDKDFWRANVVRNAWVGRHGEAEGFWDADIWSKAKTEGEAAVKKLIDDALGKASVTVVLISSATADLDYVRYAIAQSRKEGKGVIGIYVHLIKDEIGQKAAIGSARFGEIDKDKDGGCLFFWQLYPLYRWMIDEGESNLKHWVEEAYQKAQKKTNPPDVE